MAFATLVAAPSAALAQEPQAPPPKTTTKAPDQAMTAEERLAACAKKYAQAKTYRDECVLVAEFKIPTIGQQIREKKPFRTAFERGERLYWQYRGSAIPGKEADLTYAVWSADQTSFKSFWTLNGQTSTFKDLTMALAGPTGVSGGSALAVIPLLRPDIMAAYRITNLQNAADKGVEVIDGQECTKTEGTALQRTITIWMDKDLAIRRIREVAEIDPSKLPNRPAKDIEKFTVTTTMDLKPVFNQNMDDQLFKPPAAAK